MFKLCLEHGFKTTVMHTVCYCFDPAAVSSRQQVVVVSDSGIVPRHMWCVLVCVNSLIVTSIRRHI